MESRPVSLSFFFKGLPAQKDVSENSTADYVGESSMDIGTSIDVPVSSDATDPLTSDDVCPMYDDTIMEDDAAEKGTETESSSSEEGKRSVKLVIKLSTQ